MTKRTKRIALIAITLMMGIAFFSIPAAADAASKPAKATIKTCQAEGSDTVKVTWKKVKKSAGYELVVSDGETYDLNAKTLSTKVTGLESETTYTFKVRAYKNGKQDKRVYGQFSKAKKATTGIKVDRENLAPMLINQMIGQNQKSNYAAGGFTWDTERKTKSWTYYNGLMMQAFINAGETGYAEDFYDDNINEDGTIRNYRDGELDSIAPSRGLFYLLDSENADKYMDAIQFTFSKLEEQREVADCGGNVNHKQNADGTAVAHWAAHPVALDGLYMSLPFLMECANAIEAGQITLYYADGTEVMADELYDTVYSRMTWIYDNLNAGDLLMHGYNPASGKTNGLCWSRGAGWYCMCLVDVIEMMPVSEYEADLTSILGNVMVGLMNYQDESGLWYNVPNYGDELAGNKLEVSGSAMFAYTMLKAYNRGILTESFFAESALKALDGIAEITTVDNGDCSVGNIYKASSVVVNAADYCTGQYVANEAKGIGPVIMALLEA
ncbi:MAG: glycoside hydrolase family 88 protein [Bacillota bacterium]|nr:glycoside hydrolase family 88 protein [Bacillota bacterium]